MGFGLDFYGMHFPNKCFRIYVSDANGKEVFKIDNENKEKAEGTKKRSKSSNAQKKLFRSRKECEELVESYFSKYLSESGEVADIEGLADYLGMTRDEMIGLMNDKSFGKILRLARNRIAKIKKQLAFGGKIPAAVLSFDLKNNHGYRDKPEDSDSANHEQVIFKGKAQDWAQ